MGGRASIEFAMEEEVEAALDEGEEIVLFRGKREFVLRGQGEAATGKEKSKAEEVKVEPSGGPGAAEEWKGASRENGEHWLHSGYSLEVAAAA